MFGTRCDCLPGWFGLHCTQKTSICNTENSEALCGEHGVCVAKSSSSVGYTCICDQVRSSFPYRWFNQPISRTELAHKPAETEPFINRC